MLFFKCFQCQVLGGKEETKQLEMGVAVVASGRRQMKALSLQHEKITLQNKVISAS